MSCQCASCLISRAVANKELPKHLADAFLLGYHYYGMLYSKSDNAGWHAEGVNFYGQQDSMEKLAEIIKKADKQI